MRTSSEEIRLTRPLKPLQIGPLSIDPPVLQAPMAGYTNYAYRQIVREYGGVGLHATEMVNAKGFVWLDERAEHPDRLWGVREEARPLAVQIWDNDPETMARVGGRLVEEFRVSIVDINFGCPVKQVTEKAHSGSYLLRFPERMGAIIERVVAACAPTPVTAKIRLGCTRDNINAIDVAQVVEGAGAAALTVHGRTAQDMFTGSADWERISAIKPYLKRIPLIGNGDLDSAEKVVAAFNRYDVDGIMIARASLGRPWLFSQVQAALRGEPIPLEPTLVEQRDCLLRHYRLVVERFGEEKGTQLMRKYACNYAQGRPGARMFRSLVAKVETEAEFLNLVREHFPLQPPREPGGRPGPDTALETGREPLRQEEPPLREEPLCESCG
ncbi:MAG: tRNA dihydrouridine synthase DusB [Planctomycetota bacterium]|jgi:tRNA-dihydrouridine synthase B